MGNISIRFELVIALLIVAFLGVFSALLMVYKLHSAKVKLNDVSETLDDIMQGNDNHRILVTPKDITATICYKINDIVYNYQKEIVDLKKSVETNKQLMTSLSHDVRTPLTTLIGYLDAVQKGIAVGQEKEQYIKIARSKAHDMKDYVDMLFEWFKLNSNEETFNIQTIEISELTRNILKDWIPVFEAAPLDFDIDIPEKQVNIQIDTDAYSRILNNLIQNVVSHSGATCISVKIYILDNKATVCVIDNGKGIDKQDLLHVFERLYKCDKARSEKGSGLGLSIVQQLVEKMGGTIMAESELNQMTAFYIQFPLV